MKKVKIDLNEHILSFIGNGREISIHDVAQATGLSKSNEADRKAIRRALNAFVKKGLLEAKGSARARIYIPASRSTEAANAFQGISLTRESHALLKYIEQPIRARTPVSYHQDFLKSYKPNNTFYLNQDQRIELSKVGLVENKSRPAGTHARNILSRLLIDLSWNSSRLEGNTYSLLETKRLIEFGENAVGKDTEESQMIINHKGAIEYIVERASEGMITSHEVCSIHALLSENLLGDSAAEGRIRKISVGITDSTYLPLENHHVLKECFEIFIGKLNQIEDPFEQSFFALVHLSYLQAFEDVNKRTARIVANIPLIKHNLKPLSFVDVDRDTFVQALFGVYEKNDISLLCDLYVWAYQRSSHKYSAIQQAMGEPNILKLKYRTAIHDIIRTVIIEKVAGAKVVARIQALMKTHEFQEENKIEMFKIIEIEMLNLHDGNIARFKIRPSEYQAWKKLQ